jgi:hypothetical protein
MEFQDASLRCPSDYIFFLRECGGVPRQKRNDSHATGETAGQEATDTSPDHGDEPTESGRSEVGQAVVRHPVRPLSSNIRLDNTCSTVPRLAGN